MITFDRVSFQYDALREKYAVRDVSFSIEQGSFVAVLGHNGSGKSTLAKLMNGMLKPTEGHVTVDGMDTADELNEMLIKRRVGMVFQNPDNQLVATVVEEDIAFGLENIGLEREEMKRRVAMALEEVGMSEYREAAPYNLSGGQKQRIAIAGIIAMQPRYIVLDEPTSMLDPVGRRDVIGTIVSLCKNEGITVILITHFMEEALLADRVVVMNGGSVMMDGRPDEVFTHTEELTEIGLDVPVAAQVSEQLRENGLDLGKVTVRDEELIALLKHKLAGGHDHE